MRSAEYIVVGGGPAGSAAARRLVQAGADVLVLDRAAFPRPKLCAGWITPEVLDDLQVTPGEYPYGFLSFRRLHFHLKGLHLPVPALQHSIRRYEFDAWLLERSGARCERHTVRQIVPVEGGYEIDGQYRARYLIGAGGTACPVQRTLFRTAAPRVRALQTATLELEWACDWQDPDCHLWFFEAGLPGYAWYVPKDRGWLNVGIGAMAQRLKARGEDLHAHWQRLLAKLQRDFGIRIGGEPGGYSYYLAGGPGALRQGDAVLTGDAAGLATRDLCEGIGPAIRSGQRAAEALLHGTDYTAAGLTRASLGGGLVSRWMDWAFTRGAH